MTEIIKAEKAIELIRSGGAVLIDVREPDEFKQEHIAFAYSVPLGFIEKGFTSLGLPADKIILFHCQKGKRGGMACERIKGLEECSHSVANIEGGIDACRDAGFPIITSSGSGPKISIFRQVQIIVGFLIALLVFVGFMGLSAAFMLAGVLGAALFMAGVTGWCGLAMALSRMPWNK